VRKLLRSLATLAGLRVANAALDVANAALRTTPGPVRGAPPAIEARVVVTDEPSRGLTYGFTPEDVAELTSPRRTRAVIALEIAEEKRLHDRLPIHFKDKRAVHMELIYRLLDELNALPADHDA
jgi:hypothetical protein